MFVFQTSPAEAAPTGHTASLEPRSHTALNCETQENTGFYFRRTRSSLPAKRPCKLWRLLLLLLRTIVDFAIFFVNLSPDNTIHVTIEVCFFYKCYFVNNSSTNTIELKDINVQYRYMAILCPPADLRSFL